MNQLIKLIDMPAKCCDTLCSALTSTVTDYPQQVNHLFILIIVNLFDLIFCVVMLYDLQSWEEMMATGLNILNYIGPLRKNKNSAVDDDPTIDMAQFDFERFKRHLMGLLERVSRMSFNGDQKVSDIDDTLTEEDDENAHTAKQEESDWIFDVEKTMDVLPRLQNNLEDNNAATNLSKD